MSESCSFQTRRNASPIFLFVEPLKQSTIECTIYPIVFTNTITSSWSYSVASVKLRMLQKPNMAHFLFPGIIGSTSPPLAMFYAMISDPASPKPRANNTPILMMAFSTTYASFSCPSASLTSLSFSPLALIGLRAILLTFSIIASTGSKISRFASLLKYKAPRVSTKHTNMVLSIPSSAVSFASYSLSSISNITYITVSPSSGLSMATSTEADSFSAFLRSSGSLSSTL